MPSKITIHDRNRATLYCRAASLSLILVSKSLEGYRRWLKSGDLLFTPSPYNIKILEKHHPGIPVEEERAIVEMEIIGDVSAREYRVVKEPYAFQAMAQVFMAMAPEKNVALFCDPGTGKTKMAIDRTGYLWTQGEVDTAIVIAPKGVHTQWATEQIPEHCGSLYRTKYWHNGLIRPMGNQPKGEFINWYCLSYETWNSKNGQESITAFLRGVGKFILILDESHFCKNVKARRWAACNEIRLHPKCNATLLLTGTPIAKDLSDEWAQLKILDEKILDIRFLTNFRNEYCIMSKGRPYQQVAIGARNLEKFKGKTAPYIFRARKEDPKGLTA